MDKADIMTKGPANIDILADLKTLIPRITQLNLNAQEIGDDANLYEDCGLDSISFIDFLVAIEALYGISLAPEQLDPKIITNLGALAAQIRAQMQSGREEARREVNP